MKMKARCVLACTLAAALITAHGIQADQIALDVSPAYGTLKAGPKQNTWVRIGLVGFKMEAEQKRAPVNIVLVLDKSGSMSGEKIARAKSAAMDAIDRLNADDIVSVVTYDTTVNVLVPATKLTDKADVKSKISQVSSNGGTALFAGVSKGAAELRKFLDKERINRIILLSDGLANEGPSSPTELGALGASLKKEGISVSTLGLGLDYNEDLMAKLAARSGGNHHFVENATELADVFNSEFKDVTSVVAQNVTVRVVIPEGIRPIRVLGNESEISGQSIFISLNQIYSEQDKYVVLELELPETEHGQTKKLVNVTASYLNMQTHDVDHLVGSVTVNMSNDAELIQASVNQRTMEDVIEFVANERSKLATAYLDAGDWAKCTSTLQDNANFLKENLPVFNCPRLEDLLISNELQLDAVQNRDFNRARKDMRYIQNTIDNNGFAPQSKLQVQEGK